MVSIAVSAPAHDDALQNAVDWGRVVVATLARGVVMTLLGLALWAAAPAVIGWQPTTVMTGSMEPRLTPGDVVVSRPVAAVELRQGQILLADDPDQPGHLRMHRYVRNGADGTIVTKGDANPQEDSTPIERSAVHGVGFLRIPYIGTPIVWLRDGEWHKVVLLALALTVVLYLATIDGSLRRMTAATPDADGTEPDAADDLGGGTATTVEDAPDRSEPEDRDPRDRRRARAAFRIGGSLVVLLVAAGAAVAVPTKASAAPFATTTNASASFAAGTVVAPSALKCANNSDGKSVTLSWSYTGTDTPASFDVLNGTAVYANVSATTRSQVLTAGTTSAAGTRTISVRTNTSTSWTATSASVSVVVTNNGAGTVTAKCG